MTVDVENITEQLSAQTSGRAKSDCPTVILDTCNITELALWYGRGIVRGKVFCESKLPIPGDNDGFVVWSQVTVVVQGADCE